MTPTENQIIEILLKEYDTLRVEIIERLRLAFSHLGYVGAIVVFAIPLAKTANVVDTWAVIGAIVGAAVLGLISMLNWAWLRQCATQLRDIEQRIDALIPESTLLTWERRASHISKNVFWFPKSLEQFLTSPDCELQGKVPNNPLQRSGEASVLEMEALSSPPAER